MSGPAATSLLVSHTAGSPSLYLRLTAQGLEASAYLSYDPKTQTWSNPVAVRMGATTFETTKQTGATILWTGSATSAQGTVPMRDTYVIPNMHTYVDATEIQVNGTWQTLDKLTCNKTI